MNERIPSGPVIRVEMRSSTSVSLQTKGRPVDDHPADHPLARCGRSCARTDALGEAARGDRQHRPARSTVSTALFSQRGHQPRGHGRAGARGCRPGVSAEAIMWAARLRATSSWARRSSRSSSTARSAASRRASASASRAGVTSWRMITRPTMPPPAVAHRRGRVLDRRARPPSRPRAVASRAGSSMHRAHARGVLLRVDEAPLDPLVEHRCASAGRRSGSRSMPRISAAARVGERQAPAHVGDDDAHRARRDDALERLPVAAAAGRQLVVARGERDLRARAAQQRSTARLGHGRLAREAHQGDRAERRRVRRAASARRARPRRSSSRCSAPAGPPSSASRGEAGDLGGLGDEARPDHRRPASTAASPTPIGSMPSGVSSGRERLGARPRRRRSSPASTASCVESRRRPGP